MSSAISFTLNQFKILPSGNGLIQRPFPTPLPRRVSYRSSDFGTKNIYFKPALVVYCQAERKTVKQGQIIRQECFFFFIYSYGPCVPLKLYLKEVSTPIRMRSPPRLVCVETVLLFVNFLHVKV